MKIICIGRNYSEHAKELGNKVPKKPLFFLKPDSAILPKKQAFFYPEFTKDIHYELEIVVKINRLGKHIEERFAKDYYQEISVGLDLTARDLQEECKEKGLPWEIAKGFDGSAIIGQKFVDKSTFGDEINFHLLRNGEKVQVGNSKNMIFTVDKIIAYVSQFMTLKIGDLIFTGTPAGVGSISINDKLEGFLEDEKLIDLRVK